MMTRVELTVVRMRLIIQVKVVDHPYPLIHDYPSLLVLWLLMVPMISLVQLYLYFYYHFQLSY